MSFNISAKVYAINNAFFFTKILHIEKPGGDRGGTGGGNGSGNSHDLKIFEKTGGEPGGDRGGTGPSIISILFCKKHQYNSRGKESKHPV